MGFAWILFEIISAGMAREEEIYRHRCTGRFSLASTQADSVRIADDGCAYFLGKELER